MAVEVFTQNSDASGYRKRPIDAHGKLRFHYSDFGPLTVAGDAGSTYELGKLPPGPVRLLPCLSRWECSAYGAARVLKTGHKEYRKAQDGAVVDDGLEADDDNAFQSAVDISGALSNQVLGTALKFDMYSTAGVDLYATVTGGTSPIGATIAWLIAYLYE